MDTFPAGADSDDPTQPPAPGCAARRTWWYTFVSRPPGQSHLQGPAEAAGAAGPICSPASGCSGAGSHVGGPGLNQQLPPV